MLPSTLPPSRVPSSRDAPPLRWGVLGTGWIADRFVGSLRRHTQQSVHAVGSRSEESASAFATRHGVPVGYGSYEALCSDPRVDVVYVATPHNHHVEHALLAIAAGRHVVVEKPLGVDADEGRRIADAARTAGVYCLEALWTLFLPKYDVLRHLLDDGVIGRPRTMVVDMGEWIDAGHRIWRPDLAGGPMLDLGTYPVALSTWALGEPVDVVALATPAETGVDAQLGAVLRSTDGALTVISSSVEVTTPTSATLGGADGEIVIDGPFYQPGRLVVRDRHGHALTWEEPAVAHDALHFEAAAAARDIVAGRTESAIRPLAASLATLRTMDRITVAARDPRSTPGSRS